MVGGLIVASDTKSDVPARRKHFNEQIAPTLASQLGVSSRAAVPRASSRFSYFSDETRFLVIAGPQEASEVGLALAHGMSLRGDRQLVLVLPRGHTLASLQRAPWFVKSTRPEIWEHNGARARSAPLGSRQDTIDRLGEPRRGKSPEAELRKAATGLHLGARSAQVAHLADWATSHPVLDPGHRKGERSWHCMGQKVLSIVGTKGGLQITAGVHYADAARRHSTLLAMDQDLTAKQMEQLRRWVEAGVEARLRGRFRKPDEHWLQAVIRRNPAVVHVEQPALRELPAWRPMSAPPSKPGSHQWGRGYIDLIGMDGQGDIRIVETKIADNKDEMLVLQGLDYFIWAKAYEAVLRARLGAADKAKLELNYIIGCESAHEPALSPYTKPLVIALDESVRWRFQFIYNWQGADSHPDEVRSQQLEPMTV